MSDLVRWKRGSFLRQERIPLGQAADAIVEQKVADALAASPSERMAAALALADAVYALWLSRGMTDDPGLCRFPGPAQ